MYVLYSYSILSTLDDTPNKETVDILQQCMMEVWRVASATTTINLDQQQKLIEVLDNLSTKAITVSPTGICIQVVCVIFDCGFEVFVLCRSTDGVYGDVEGVEVVYYYW